MDPEDIGGIRLDDIFTGFGNMLLTICILMILVNILLLVSSTTKQPYISLPWIIANFITGVVILHIENKSAPLRRWKIINLPQNCAMNFQKFPYF